MAFLTGHVIVVLDEESYLVLHVTYPGVRGVVEIINLYEVVVS